MHLYKNIKNYKILLLFIPKKFLKNLHLKNIYLKFKKSTQIKKVKKNIYIFKKIKFLKKIKIKKLQLIKIFIKNFYQLQKKRFLNKNFYQLQFLYFYLKLKKKQAKSFNFYRKTFFFCKKFLKNLKNKAHFDINTQIIEKKWFELFLHFNFSYNTSIYHKFFQKFFYHHTHMFGQTFFKNIRILFKYRNQRKYALAQFQKNNRILVATKNFYIKTKQKLYSPFFLTVNSFLALNKFFEKYNFSYAIVNKNSKKKSKDFVGCLVFNSKFFLILTFLRSFFMQKNYNISKFILKASSLQNYIWFLGYTIFYKQANNFQQYKQILVNSVFQKISKKIVHTASFKIRI